MVDDEKKEIEVLGDDEDYEYSIEASNLTREALAKKFPSSLEELKRLAAEAVNIRIQQAPVDRVRKPRTFTKRVNSGGHRGTRSLRSR
jgi:hypothetical protein